jgi:hypothetical protein
MLHVRVSLGMARRRPAHRVPRTRIEPFVLAARSVEHHVHDRSLVAGLVIGALARLSKPGSST